MTDGQEPEPRYIRFSLSREGGGPDFLVEWPLDIGPLFMTCAQCGAVTTHEPDDTSEDMLAWMILHTLELEPREADHQELGHSRPFEECPECTRISETHRGRSGVSP